MPRPGGRAVMADAESNQTPRTRADLLDAALAALNTYVVFTGQHYPKAATLWTAVTHGMEAWNAAPRLVITSPQKRCAKSRLLDVITGMCHDPLSTTDATVAAIFRSIGESPPTLIFDEADAMFGTKKQAENNEDLRALINAGHQRGRTVLRCVGPRHDPTEFPCFAMVALAGKGTGWVP